MEKDCGEDVGVRGLETLRPLGVAGVLGLGRELVVGVGGEEAVVYGLGDVCEDEGDTKVALCVAEAVVSLSARAYPASVRENLKLQKIYFYCLIFDHNSVSHIQRMYFTWLDCQTLQPNLS